MKETKEGKKKSRPLPSDNHTNTGPLETLSRKHFRKHLKNCPGNFPAWLGIVLCILYWDNLEGKKKKKSNSQITI